MAASSMGTTITRAASAVGIAALLVACAPDTQNQADKIMRGIGEHADTARATRVEQIEAGLRLPDFAKGATIQILGSEQLRQVTPGSEAAWARIRVRLHSPYISGPAGQPTEVTRCYRLDFNYYGLKELEHIGCPR